MKDRLLPPGYPFSQSSLQDYVDCPRRFELRYVLRQAWPAVQAQPVTEHERHIWRGLAFHRLAHQHTLGISTEELTAAVSDSDLGRWWQAYLAHPPDRLPSGLRLAEVALFTHVQPHPTGDSYRLLAKYDLIAADSAQVVIVDWKTDQRRPSSEALARRLQSRVYPFVIVEAGASLCRMAALRAGQVTMIYWFADYPSQIERIGYEETQHQANRRYLLELMAEIAGHGIGDFPLTQDERRCRFCVYRSLCDRGTAAGDLSEVDESSAASGWADPDVDLEQVAETAY